MSGADRIRRLAGSEAMVTRREVHTELQRCDGCRGMVPFTTLVLRDESLYCGDCLDGFGDLRRIFPGLFEDEA